MNYLERREEDRRRRESQSPNDEGICEPCGHAADALEYAVLVKHPGFVDRFIKDDVPPQNIDMNISWYAMLYDEPNILRFRRRESAEHCKRRYELHFAARQEPQYSFALMKLITITKWVPDQEVIP
jgi:hypothetical protein